MHRLKDIEQYQMTRDVILESLETGMVDVCFDDSDMVFRHAIDFKFNVTHDDCFLR